MKPKYVIAEWLVVLKLFCREEKTSVVIKVFYKSTFTIFLSLISFSLVPWGEVFLKCGL